MPDTWMIGRTGINSVSKNILLLLITLLTLASIVCQALCKTQGKHAVSLKSLY